jgi:hypothetical protein
LKVSAIKNPPSAVTAHPDRAVELDVGGWAAVPGDTGDHVAQ